MKYFLFTSDPVFYSIAHIFFPTMHILPIFSYYSYSYCHQFLSKWYKDCQKTFKSWRYWYLFNWRSLWFIPTLICQKLGK